MLSNVALLYFVLLIPLAGFIAWAGDHIGHRTGKRRQSLFGLRPRHTALIFTIASGMAIAFVSFGIFWVFSESFRAIVRDGWALYQHNRELKRDNIVQAAELEQAKARVARLHRDAEHLHQERQTAAAARDRALKALAEVQKKQALAERRRVEAEQQYQAAQANYRRAEANLAEARSSLRGAKASLTRTQRDLGAARQELQAETRRVRNAESQLAVARAKVKLAEERIASARAEQSRAEKEAAGARANADRIARTARETLDYQREQLNKLREELGEQNTLYAELSGKTEEQRIELARLNRELTQKRAEYDKLVSNTAALRGKHITYQVGEEVDRIAIRSGTTVWRIQYILETFLTAAAQKAERRGARRGGEEREVIILPTLLANATPVSAGGPRRSSEEDALHTVANQIRSVNKDMLVVAVSAANAVAGEPVAIQLRVYANPVVLKRDTRIGEITLNGERSRQELADTLYSFLSRDIHQKLLEAGVIPPARGGEESGQEFSLSGEDWFKLMEDVRRGGRRPRVTVFAAADLRAGDPVTLRFSVRATDLWNSPDSIPDPTYDPPTTATVEKP